jgi:threonine aldolase
MSYAPAVMIPVGSRLPVTIDLSSDTATRPSPGMRTAMARAEVGDEQRGEDPSTEELLRLSCELLGKEAAVFLPSGTMCNQISYAVHCRPGDEILVDQSAHALHYEGAGPAQLAGVLVTPVASDRGVFTATALAEVIRAPSRHAPRTSLMSIEQTSNLGGGRCWSHEDVLATTATAREHGLRCHMDGARLLNAVVATDVSAAAFCASFDSVWIDLSKGLGAPLGAVLAGDRSFIEEAWRLKQRWGGAMRQSGVVAAAGTYALRHHVERLAEDHEHARVFAHKLAEHPCVSIDPASVQTNIVLFELAGISMSAQRFADRLLEETGVRVSVFGTSTLRAVTHLDVSTPQVVEAADQILLLLDRVNQGGRHD